MVKKVLLIGTLDTKGEEFQFFKSTLQERGIQTLVMDAGVLGPPAFKPDISREEVAREGGEEIERLISIRDRGRSMEVMTKGVVGITRKLYRQQEIAAVAGMGGGSGTNLACAAMRALPLGFPKLVISTLASGDTTPFVGEKDIMMVYSVADILGINRITRQIIVNAAAAVAGMVQYGTPSLGTGQKAGDNKALISATMMGATTPCVTFAGQMLKRQDMELVAFAASSSGGRAMENMIEEGWVQGVLDITTTEIINIVAGGVFPASRHRFETAGSKGVPQVVTCGAIDFVNFWTGNIPSKYKKRQFYQHNPAAVLMRTSLQENIKAGKALAQKLNLSKGRTAFVAPLKGFSSYDIKGGPFFNPETDQAFLESVEKNLRPGIKVIKCDCHINEEQFAAILVKTLTGMMT
ncbi:MAG: Tm-1-like ATP-binding domain-containing protein [Actinomycetota bacterium]|nr:Tm-1-like ATP-binding domain-containing protein [Actinomycetota bacterium]